jgi:putative membrane protein
MVAERLKPTSTYIRRLSPSEWVMLGSFGVFCFVYPFAIVLLSLDLMPFGMEWMSSLLLAMLGLSAWGWLWANFGSRGLALGAMLFLLGVAVEYAGVQTGIPFGTYHYTGVLVPQLPGGVPLALGFAWLLIVVGGLFTARHVLRSFRLYSGALAVVAGAALAVGLDLLLEPVAYHVKKYWLWEGDAQGYYGVPWSNFTAWFVVGLALGFILFIFTRSDRPLLWNWLPIALYCMNVVMFGLVNVAHGFWIAGLIGAVILGVLLIPLVLRRAQLRDQP